MPPALYGTLGDYRLLAHLGRGGMGDVYRAEHARLGRVVALKMLRDAGLSARFLNEARIQAGLTHPHIATLFDYFEAGGRACIAMELVEGETFADRLHRRGPCSFAEAVGLLRPVAEAVAYLHAHGIIHRDLKAHNVKVTPEGDVKLLDFGIAKELGAAGLTQAGMVPGTPEYLSPEQVRGRPPDARSDVWALGVLLYELVTGDLPFQAPSSFELFQRIARADYAPPSTRAPGVPAACDALVARCLQAEPSHRFADAGAFLAALPAAPTPCRSPAPPSARPRRSKPGGSLGRHVAALGRRLRPPPEARPALRFGLFGLGAVGLLFVLLLTAEPSTPAEDPERTPTTQRAIPAGAVRTQVVINAFGPPAEVYRHGRRLGLTPYPLATYVGEAVELTLRRGGAERVVRFETSVGKRAYSFSIPSP